MTERPSPKIVTRPALAEALATARARGATVVQCDGVFDLLHPGHFRHLEWARAQGDILVVSLRPDRVIRPTAPALLPEQDRARFLAAVEMVDFVIVDDETWVGSLLDLVRPDVYVKGEEFEHVVDGLFGEERKRVEAYGGELRFSSGDTATSTPALPRNPLDARARMQISNYCTRHGIGWERIDALLTRCRDKRILVVGEVIVDEYTYCDPLGMSADSPTVVVRPLSTERFVGGAGIVAMHVASLGARCHFVSVAGRDEEADFVREQLELSGVSFDLIEDTNRPTIHKRRFVASGKKLLNVNTFRDQDLSTKVCERVLAAIAEQADHVDGVVISDFSYGGMPGPVIDALVRLRERDVPVVGDVQSSSQVGRVTRLRRLTTTTPSEREARMALWDRDSGVADVGVRLLQETQNDSVVVTLGPRGVMVVVDAGTGPWTEIPRTGRTHEIKPHLTIDYLPSFASMVVDSMGAGDAMLATIGAVLAAGGTMLEAVYLGNCASSVAVSQMGNVPVGLDALRVTARRRLG